ncbi:ABC transporter substrate-binding protein [Sporichthya polymorpha]|uniref:ABC transporter substrate-binding protein n=1 Tax=Sporichthya polymorpha TaxID=35751 RepID=UPI0003741B58|nr:ABC transporter substrate-binding protein [Sporichthya polymorpha]
MTLLALALAASLTGCGNRNPEAEVAAAAGVGAVSAPPAVADPGAGVSGAAADAPAGGVAGPAAAPAAGAPAAGGAAAPATAGTNTGTKPAAGAGTAATAGAGNSGTAKTNTPKVANLSPINVGLVGTFSGPIGALVGGTTTGARVWASHANANGGANGHPINVLVGDDGGDPARYNSLVKEFVEQRNVIAFVQNTLGFAPAGNNEYLNAKKIVTFSSEGGLNQFYENPYTVTAFPAGDMFAKAIIGAVAQEAVRAGKTKVASFACSDFSICDLFDATWKDPAYMKSIGLTPMMAARPSLTQPDYTANCLAAKQAGADLLVFGMDSASIERFASDCARQNYRPMLGTGDIVVNAGLPKADVVDGIVIGTKIAPWTATNVEGVRTFIDALARYAPGVAPDGSNILGWAAGAFFGAAAVNLPAENPTAADVFKGVYQIKGESLGGMTYPLDFTKGKSAPKKLCFGIVVVKGKKFTQGPGPALNCPKG